MKTETMILKQDINEIVNSKYINWGFFKNSTILITGATGLIGSMIVFAILEANKKLNTNIKIIALVRNIEKAKKIFEENEKLTYIIQDIINPISTTDKIDFIIHSANTTSSKAFVENPIETIATIIDGTKNILNLAKDKNCKSLIYLSSMEIYGYNNNLKKNIKENDYGFIELLDARNSYPQAKRLAETLCYSYFSELNLPIKIARLTQIIGSNVNYNDNRVYVQFARNVAENKDIVLHTKGETVRAYCYITDAISAIFKILEKGENGEAYNISNEKTECSIKQMAKNLCKQYKNSKLKIELENINNKYYLKKTKTVLNSQKLKNLGWSATIDLDEMYKRLIESLKKRGNNEQ